MKEKTYDQRKVFALGWACLVEVVGEVMAQLACEA